MLNSADSCSLPTSKKGSIAAQTSFAEYSFLNALFRLIAVISNLSPPTHQALRRVVRSAPSHITVQPYTHTTNRKKTLQTLGHGSRVRNVCLMNKPWCVHTCARYACHTNQHSEYSIFVLKASLRSLLDRARTPQHSSEFFLATGLQGSIKNSNFFLPIVLKELGSCPLCLKHSGGLPECNHCSNKYERFTQGVSH